VVDLRDGSRLMLVTAAAGCVAIAEAADVDPEAALAAAMAARGGDRAAVVGTLLPAWLPPSSWPFK
jgi:hypothetical protein